MWKFTWKILDFVLVSSDFSLFRVPVYRYWLWKIIWNLKNRFFSVFSTFLPIIRRLFFLNTKKYNLSQIFMSKSLVFSEQKSKWAIRSEKTIDLLICSFILSDLSKSLTVAHLSWATWAIRSWLLFWHERHEQPERFAHSRSFVPSDLSESLTVTHLIWAMWANERWANEQIPNPATL